MTRKRRARPSDGEDILEWLQSQPMWGASNALQYLGWAMKEPVKVRAHWEVVQTTLAKVTEKEGDPPCT